ncbi:MAG: hypothetical protein WD069_06555 [Planctomycetales bacterium]
MPRRLMSCAVAATWVTACPAFSPAAENAERAQVRERVARLVAQDALRDLTELHSLGSAGLAAVLDRLLPDSAHGADDPQLLRLIAAMGDDDFEVRERATATLLVEGRGVRIQLEAAAGRGDPEIRWRAAAILEAWSPGEDFAACIPSFIEYLDGIRDEERLDLLAERTVAALGNGIPDFAHYAQLAACLRRLCATENDRYCDPFVPLLKHEDVGVPVTVIREFGNVYHPRFYPNVFLDGLRSDRTGVVKEAIGWGSTCWDPERRPAVQGELQKVFATGPEDLRFLACGPLIRDHDDPRAIRYVLEQTRSDDPQRVRSALICLGAIVRSKPASRELLDHVAPFLRSDDHKLRRAATEALRKYTGEEVVQGLIPLLGDSKEIIVAVSTDRLRNERDKAMLRRSLEAAERDHADPAVRAQARELLDELARQASPASD